MSFSRTGAVALLALVAVAGCSSSRLSGLSSSEPEPLVAAPSGQVTGTQPLPPPGTTAAVTDPSAFPPPPGTDPNAPPGTSPTATAAVAPPVTSGPDISKNGVVGSWNVASGGSGCQMFLTLTKYGNASRGGTRGCSGDLANMRGWDVQGKQLVVFNDGGGTIARLYSSSEGRFDGQTESGTPVSLTR